MRSSVQSSSGRLRGLRLRAAMSQRELARAAGVAPNTIRHAESGGIPQPGSQRLIAQALSLALDEPVDHMDLWPEAEATAA